MTAKWLDKRSLFRVATLMAVLAGSAQAQLVDGQWRAAPAAPQRTRVAVQVNAPTVFAQPANPMFYPQQPVHFTYVPTIMMSDGSVYANYGYGYQRIVTCGPVTPYVSYGNGVVYGAPTVPSQVPNQPTQSQQIANQFGGQVTQSPCGQQQVPQQHGPRTPAPTVGRRY